MRLVGSLRVLAVFLSLALLWLCGRLLLQWSGRGFGGVQYLTGSQDIPTVDTKPKRYSCGLPLACPEKHFAFKMVSGAANVIGPKVCLDDVILMSSVKNNVGRGLNVALVNGVTGELMNTKFFDMWLGDHGVNDLLKFLRTIHEGTLVFVASYDDPATKMNVEVKQLFGELGSKAVTDLGFRDSWIFVGAKGIDSKSPFEQIVKNDNKNNKYEGWPSAVQMEGCIPHLV